MIKSACITAIALLPLATFSAAADIHDDIAVTVSKSYIIPAYDALAKASGDQADAWQAGCDAGNMENLKKQFHQVTDSWAAIQHLNYGPVTLLLRRDRLYHWPERRNAVSKALGKLMTRSADELQPAALARTSVAGQGLPALERLLFEDGGLEGDTACLAGQSIAANITDITEGTARDWQDGELNVLLKLEQGQPHDIWFDSNEEVANKLFTELMAGFQMITDQKLGLPMGKDITTANPKRAELWRSGRPARNIRQNSRGLIEMARAFTPFLRDETKAPFEAALQDFDSAAQALPNDFASAVTTEKGRAALNAYKTELRRSRDFIAATLTGELGLVLGFNSLDGD